MDILPINSLHVITIAFRVLFVVAGIMIVVINYLHVKEAKKMEDKLSVALPGSIQLAISMQLILSIIFLFAIIVFLFVL